MVGEVECRRVGREHSKGWAISSRTRICTFKYVWQESKIRK